MSSGGLPWITEWDLMLGLDWHNELCIPPVPPLPPLPSDMHGHVSAATMRWATNADQFGPPTVFVENRAPCKHFHNISFFIPHIPVPLPGWVLLPAIIPLSSSKIVFGSFSVHSTDAPVGLWGLNLNCCSNFPLPTGLIIPTRLPTVFVGVTYVDILWSLGYVAFDILASFVVNKIFDFCFKKLLNRFFEMVLGKLIGEFAEVEFVTALNQIIVKLAGDYTKKAAGWAGKSLLPFPEETIKAWLAQANAGIQDIHSLIAEAPQKFAAYVHETLLPQLEQAAHESLQRDHPELHALLLEEPPPRVSPQEFEHAIQETLGPMIKDAVRGLLSGDQWKKLSPSHNPAAAGPRRP